MSWTGSALLDAPVLVRTAEEKAARKAYNNVDAIYAADQAGEPCACGTDDDPRPCLAHHWLSGHRRHVRPGREYEPPPDNRRGRTHRRPRYA